ncbi:uncharacterized protein [Euwallacea similis]|uniref:uncharacterized protein n=1 Tax=Euwallacea similis TaxID=1736056 RepID=UPI00344B6B01
MTDPEIDNINQIDISYGYDIIQKYKAIDYAMSDTKNTYEIGNAFGKASIETHKVFLESSEGQNLIHNPDNNFDLFIVEAQYEGTSIYSWKFDIPTIGICSMDCSIQFHDAVGNFVHPITNPDQNISIEDIHSTSFWERLYSFLFLLAYRFIISALAHPKQTQILKTYFGENVPPIENIKNNIDMLFLATNPVFQPVRAVMPNTITIGSGTLISDPQPLRQEIQDFLDSANSGAIYFSLGSNIKARHMNLTIKRSIIKAFSTMPYKVLWKIEDDFENLPSNVFTSKWFTSQPDILHHSNIKLFITQGGLQSMQESLHANKPMIGIPFFGDQFGNINRMVQLGYGLKINKYNITEHSIRETVTEIMSNPKYLRNAHKYGNILRDVDISDVEKAVWWTEYVIRHKGAKHFRNAALDMPFWKRYMLDVYAVTALFNVIIFLISLFIFRKFVRLVKMLFGAMLLKFLLTWVLGIELFDTTQCLGANILAIMPTPSYSHQLAFRPLWKSLSRRGHNVTLITTDPMNDQSLGNLTEIHLNEAYEWYQKYQVIDLVQNDSSSLYQVVSAVLYAMIDSNRAFLDSFEGQNLLYNKDNHFDLVIIEAVSPALIFFGWIYRAPLIGICSMDCAMQAHDGVGNTVNPIVNPDFNLIINELTFLERLIAFGFTWGSRAVIYFIMFPLYEAMMKDYFEVSPPSLREMHMNGIVKMLQTYVTVTILLSLVSNSIGADILVIIPTASFSHQVTLRPLWKQLAARGHNVTLVTTDPMNEEHLENIQQINISYGYEYMKKYEVMDIVMNDSKSLYDSAVAIRKVFRDTQIKLFESPEGLNLAHNKENHFDLLFVEAQVPDMMIYSWVFDIPFIGICSLDCALQYHETAGNHIHPVTNPDQNFVLKDIYSLSFRERLLSSVHLGLYQFLVKCLMFPKQHAIWREYFGEDVPSVDEIQSRMSMLFVATNPVFHLVRALMPNTVTIGSGMQLSAPKPLTKDIKDFLDDAHEGAIYFSLGSNIKGKHLNATMKKIIINAFSKMPYKVVWKIEDVFDKMPPNILTSKWFSSQLDILRHPNVKLFITQGGLQSMQESIYANKPMIGISYFGDQHGNVNRMVGLGYGLKILKQNITEESIRETVTEIMTNPVYTANAQKYGEIFRDVDMADVDKAVWWTEYVIRHKGATHFRNPLLDMPFWKRYMLDVFGVILLVSLIIFKVISFTFRIIRYLLKAGKPYGIKKKVA